MVEQNSVLLKRHCSTGILACVHTSAIAQGRATLSAARRGLGPPSQWLVVSVQWAEVLTQLTLLTGLGLLSNCFRTATESRPYLAFQLFSVV